MSLERWSRLFAHLSLALACACLIQAEAPFLPGLQICLPPVMVLLLLAFWSEGRWALPAWGANLLGLLIAAGAAAWLAVHLSDGESGLSQIPLPTALVPQIGPVLMALLLVKLFRPRGPGDFWLLQGMGLLQVGLGCVLATAATFGPLLVAYLACAVGCLALHYRRAGIVAASGPLASGTLPASEPLAATAPVAGWLVLFTGRWTLAVAGLALLLFLLTPRRDGAGWEPLARFSLDRPHPERTRTGLGEEINLNRTGTVEVDDEVALQVAAADAAGRPKMDLPLDQRWRGMLLESYESGKWVPDPQMVMLPATMRRPQRQLPDFGPGQYFLTFTVKPRQAGGLVLADPLRLGEPPTRLPVVVLSGLGRRPALFYELSGTVLPLMLSARQEYRYRQVIPPHTDPSRVPAERLQNLYVERLTQQPVPGLMEWTIALLRRLAAEPRYHLPADLGPALAGPPREFLLKPSQWEPVARALTAYLASSGEYTYTLDLTRQDLNVDPVMDFLCNVKQGHCERYATALALMLRSVGIPARVVKGFHGADSQGDGTYLVRHSHAHSWVEALVPRNKPDAEASKHKPEAQARELVLPSRTGFDWLTLDPTASGDPPSPSAFSLTRLWQGGRRNGALWWRELIVDYNADEQADLWDRLHPARRGGALLKLGLLLVAGLALLAGLVLLRRKRWWDRRLACRGAGALPCYARLVALLTRHGLPRPRPAQTPREFGQAARVLLLSLPGAAALADLPERVADLLYRVRFGGRPLELEESRAIDAELDRLADVLHAAGKPRIERG